MSLSIRLPRAASLHALIAILALVVAHSKTLEAKPQFQVSDYDFGDVLTCDKATGAVIVTNIGSSEVAITDMILHASNSTTFSLIPPPLPVYLSPGDTMSITVEFAPNTVAAHSASIAVVAKDSSGAKSMLGFLTGTGTHITEFASIQRDYIVDPGTQVKIPVILHDEIAGGSISRLLVWVNYRPSVLQPRIGPSDFASMLTGGILDGWTVTLQGDYDISNQPGWRALSLDLSAPAGEVLYGAGALLTITFDILPTATGSTELPLTVAPEQSSCVTINTSPGLVTVNSAASTPESATTTPSISIEPNPTTSKGQIVLTLRQRAHVKATLANVVGEEVLIAEQEFPAGEQHLHFDGGSLAPGMYFCRVSIDGREFVKAVMIGL